MAAEAEDLLRRIAQGDQSALAEFYRAFEGQVYRFVLSRLNDPFEASDIVNGVMMEVWRGAARFQGRSKVSTWLLGIARHKIIDRQRKRHGKDMEELDETLVDESATDPAQALAAVEEAEILRRCLEELSEAQREVVHLAFFEDLSYSEIAQIVERPEGTIKTRVFHAKRVLQDCVTRLMAGQGP
ncbi:MAG: sigma-70 family RNA polymerase sigma factor [Kiloniellales bacterium]